VLRGPQGTLFGKNTIAGAVAIQTTKPEDEFNYGIDTQIALDDDADYALTGYINGPLSNAVNGRLVAHYRDSEGWLTNTAEGNRQVPKREEHAIRGSVEWDMSENVILNATYEHAVWDRVGRATQIAATQNSAVYADAVLDDNVLFTNSDPAGLFVGTDRASDYSDSDADLAVVKVVVELGGGITLCFSDYARGKYHAA
jgi:iron complex outermembrane receptor protein